MSTDRTHLGMSAGALRAIVLLFVVTFALAGLSFYHTNSTANRLRASLAAEASIAQRLRREVLSECAFNADLGGAPVPVNPAIGKPPLLGIKIVSDSRVAWHQAGCPGHLVRPARSFPKWARFYHVPVN